MRIYISGRITNNPNYKEDFGRAEGYLREKYPEARIVNPAKMGEVFQHGTWGEYMAICKTMLAMCDVIYLLKGWQKSKGAQWEYQYAQSMEMDIMGEVTA